MKDEPLQGSSGRLGGHVGRYVRHPHPCFRHHRVYPRCFCTECSECVCWLFEDDDFVEWYRWFYYYRDN